jgi:putative endonuclease
MTNKNNTVLYTGATTDLHSRIFEHQLGVNPGFTSKYNVNKLIYYECYHEPERAFEREKQIKSWSRNRKISLVESINPEWLDLSGEVHHNHVDRFPYTLPDDD